jgi:hypothetical protein
MSPVPCIRPDLMISGGGVALYAMYACTMWLYSPLGLAAAPSALPRQRSRGGLSEKGNPWNKMRRRIGTHRRLSFSAWRGAKEIPTSKKKKPKPNARCAFKLFGIGLTDGTIILNAWYNSLNIIILFCLNSKSWFYFTLAKEIFYKHFDRAFELVACLIDA